MHGYAQPAIFRMCLLVVPALLICAYFGCSRNAELTLSRLRNGVGLASFVLILVNWLFVISRMLLFQIHAKWVGFEEFSRYWMWFEVYLLPLTLLLAFTWKGLSRLQLLAAGILMWGLFASTIIA